MMADEDGSRSNKRHVLAECSRLMICFMVMADLIGGFGNFFKR